MTGIRFSSRYTENTDIHGSMMKPGGTMMEGEKGGLMGRMGQMMNHCGRMMNNGTGTFRPNEQWRRGAPDRDD
jgi:hypothetical protein